MSNAFVKLMSILKRFHKKQVNLLILVASPCKFKFVYIVIIKLLTTVNF